MALPKTLSFVRRADFAEVTRGQAKDAVVIHANGQISFSSSMSKELDTEHVAMSFEPKSRTLYFLACTAANVKNYKIDGDAKIDLKTSKKGGVKNFAATGILRSEAVFNGKPYDYKASGNQTFPAVNEGSNIVSIVLPEGALTPKAVKPRKPRKGATAAIAPNGSVAQETVSSDDVLTVSL